MATRKQPNYSGQTLATQNLLGYLNVLTFDTPIDALNENISIINKERRPYDEFISKLTKQVFFKERDKPGRCSMFSMLNSEQKEFYIRFVFGEPKKNEAALFLDLLDHSVKVRTLNIEALAVNNIIHSIISQPRNRDIKEISDLIHSAISFVSSSNYALQPSDIKRAFSHKIVLDLVAPLIESVPQLEKIKKLMHINRVTKKKMNIEVKSVLDSFDIERMLRQFHTVSSKRTKLTLNKHLWQGSDESAFLAMTHYPLSTSNIIDEIRSKEDKLEMLDFSEYMRAIESLEADIAKYEKAIREVYADRIVETHFKACTSTFKDRIYVGSGCAFFGVKHVDLCIEKDIDDIIELINEMIATAIAIFVKDGIEDAANYISIMQRIYANISNVNHDDSNFASALQRDYELLQQINYAQHAKDNFPVDDYTTNRQLISIFDEYCLRNPDNMYERARELRALRQIGFNPITLANEHYRAMHLIKQPNRDAMKRLESAVKYIFLKSYIDAMSELPSHLKTYSSKLEQMQYEDFRHGRFVGLEAYSSIKFYGCGASLYNSEIFQIKDSSNIIPDIKVVENADYYKNLPPEDKREVLYYATRNPGQDLPFIKLAAARPDTLPVRLFVKPEQKEGGRTITMECAPMRRVNSIMQSNLLAVSKSYWGSLIARSAHSKNEIIRKVIEYAKDVDSSGHGNLIVMCDFKKFGHTIPFEITQMIHGIASDFYGQDWMSEYMKVLPHYKMGFEYLGIQGLFKNDMSADGQGMRNGTWQIMLAAVLYAEFGNLYETEPMLIKEMPISAIYFQDDHNLIVPFRKERGAKMSEAYKDAYNRIMPKIAEKYEQYGLQLELPKTKPAYDRFTLLGDVYDLNGIVPSRAKAIGTMLRPSEELAPAYQKYVDDIATVAGSSVLGGNHPRHAWLSAVICLAIRTWYIDMRTVKRCREVLPAMWFVPRRLGGNGFPMAHHLVPGLHIYDEIDVAHAMYLHLKHGDSFANIVANISEEASKYQSAWKRISGINIHKPDILEHLYVKYKTFFGYDIQSKIAERNEIFNNISSKLKEVPSTLENFMFMLHDSSIQIARMSKIIKSATARQLVGGKVIGECRIAETYKFIKWSRGCLQYVKRNNKDYTSWKHFWINFIGEKAHYVTTLPSHLQLMPIGYTKSSQYVGVKIVSGPLVKSKTSFTLGAATEPIVDLRPLIPVGDLGRYTMMHEACYALSSEYDIKGDGLKNAMITMCNAPYEPTTFKTRGDPVVFRDVQQLQYSQPILATFIGPCYPHTGIYFDDLDPFSSEYKGHINYGAMEIQAYLRSHESDFFAATTSLIWRSPDIEMEIAEMKVIPARPRIYDTVYRIMSNKKVNAFMVEIEDKKYSDINEMMAVGAMMMQELLKKEEKANTTIKEYDTHDKLSVPIVEQIAKKRPSEASKFIWTGWVRSVLSNRIAKDANTIAKLKTLPKKFSAYNFDIVRQSDIFNYMLPNKSESKNLAQIARNMGTYENLLNWMRRVWVSIHGNTLPMDAASIENFTTRFCKACPKAFFRKIAETINFMPLDTFDKEKVVEKKNFLGMWRARYKSQLSEFQMIYKALKQEGVKLEESNVTQKDYWKLNILAAIYCYQIMILIYDDLLNSHEEIKESVDILVSLNNGVSMFVNRYVDKMSLTEYGIKSIKDLSDSLLVVDKANQSAALIHCARLVNDKLEDLFTDLGEKNYVDSFTIEIDETRMSNEQKDMIKPINEMPTIESKMITQMLYEDIDPAKMGVILKVVPKVFKAEMRNMQEQVKNRKQARKNRTVNSSAIEKESYKFTQKVARASIVKASEMNTNINKAPDKTAKEMQMEFDKRHADEKDKARQTTTTGAVSHKVETKNVVESQPTVAFEKEGEKEVVNTQAPTVQSTNVNINKSEKPQITEGKLNLPETRTYKRTYIMPPEFEGTPEEWEELDEDMKVMYCGVDADEAMEQAARAAQTKFDDPDWLKEDQYI